MLLMDGTKRAECYDASLRKDVMLSERRWLSTKKSDQKEKKGTPAWESLMSSQIS